MKPSSPCSARRSSRAAVSGSLGTLKGSLLSTRARSARPGTSTPSQNESVPSRMAFPASRKRRSSWSRGASPCTSSGHAGAEHRPQLAGAARRSAAWLVKSTNIPPSDA